MERNRSEVVILRKENEIIRKQNWELNQSVISMKHRISFLLNTQNQLIMENTKTLDETKTSKNSRIKTEGLMQNSNKQKLKKGLRPY